MPKKGSKKNSKNDIKDDDSTSSDENNENDKPTKFLTNQILNHQKLNYKKSVNNFIKNNGLIILSC
jgi:hypothetical protein